MNRRDLLTAAPACGIGGLLAARAIPAVEVPKTPIAALFRRWQAAEAEEQAAYAECAPGARCEPLSDARRELEELIMAEPCQVASDWIAKAAALSAFGTFDTDLASHRRLWAEAREMLEVSPAFGARLTPSLPPAATVEASNEPTPVMAHFRSWRDADAEIGALRQSNDKATDAAIHDLIVRQCDIEDDMFALPPEDIRDALAQLLARFSEQIPLSRRSAYQALVAGKRLSPPISGAA